MLMVDEEERADLRASSRKARAYRAALARHPSPQDPDHPSDPDDDTADVLDHALKLITQAKTEYELGNLVAYANRAAEAQAALMQLRHI